MADARMLPKEEEQDWLILPMESLGYNTNANGVCHGFAHIGIQEFLTNNLAEFDNTLSVIYKIYSEAVEECKKEHFESKRENIPWKEVEEKFLKNLRDLNEFLQFNIKAFFETINILYFGHGMDDLFPDKETKPGVLDVDGVSGLIATHAIELIGGMVNLGGFGDSVGLGEKYRLKDIEDQFKALQKISLEAKSPIGIGLSTHLSNHVISVCFNPTAKVWILIDANKHKTFPVNNVEELAKAIVTSLTGVDLEKQPIPDDKYILFYRAQIYTAGIYKNSLNGPITKLIKERKMNELRSCFTVAGAELNSLEYRARLKIKELLVSMEMIDEMESLIGVFNGFEQSGPTLLSLYKQDLNYTTSIQNILDATYERIANCQNPSEVFTACTDARYSFGKAMQKKSELADYEYQERIMELLDKILKALPSSSDKVTKFKKIQEGLYSDRHSMGQLKEVMKQIKLIASQSEGIWSMFFKSALSKIIDEAIDEKNNFKESKSRAFISSKRE